jgi:hypothetical protein
MYKIGRLNLSSREVSLIEIAQALNNIANELAIRNEIESAKCVQQTPEEKFYTIDGAEKEFRGKK